MNNESNWASALDFTTNKLPTVFSDLFAAYGANTGNYLAGMFNNLPLPYANGHEIKQYWLDKLSPEGKEQYNNNIVYKELTDPLNYVMPPATKGPMKVINFIASPQAEGARWAVTQFGKQIERNAAARAAAKAGMF